MKKTKLMLMLSVAGIALSLTSCETSDPSKTIKMWATFNTTYQAIIDKAIKEYQQTYPGYKVEYSKYNGSYDDLAKACVKGFPANNYPDMAVVYPDSVADFLMAGYGQDMTDYMSNEEYGWTTDDLEDIPEKYIEEGQKYFVQGTYSLPLCKSTEALYYNRKIIGVDLSLYDEDINNGEPLTDAYINNLTWEEFLDHLAPALVAYNEANNHSLIKTDGSHKDSWAVLGYDSDDNMFITLAEQYGYGYTSMDETTGVGSVDFVNNDMKNLMKKFNAAYKNHYIATQGTLDTYSNYLSTAGEMLFTIGSTGGVSYQFSDSSHYDVGVARIPHAEGKGYKVINQGPSIAFLWAGQQYGDLHAEQCWKFYKILTSKKYTAEWTMTTGYSPIRYSVDEDDAYIYYATEANYELETLDRLTARNAKYSTEMLDCLYSSPVFYGSSKARKAVKGLVPDCLKSTNIDSEIDGLFTKAYNNAI